MSNQPPKDVWQSMNIHNAPPEALANYERTKDLRPPLGKKPMKPASATTPPRLARVEAERTPPDRGIDYLGIALPLPQAATRGRRCFRTSRGLQDARQTLKEGLARLYGDTENMAAKYLAIRDLTPLAIATTDAPVKGGYIVPDAISDAVQLRLAKVGAARRLATIFEAPPGLTAVPTLTSLPAVFYEGEATTIGETAVEFGQLGVDVRKRGACLKMTAELIADAAPALVDTLVAVLGNTLASVEDDELINGDGTSTYGNEVGLLDRLGAGGVVSAASGHATWGTLDAKDYASLVSKLPAKFCGPENSFVCSTPMFASMSAAVPEAVGTDGKGTPTFWGKRVVVCDKMPRATGASQVSLLFGDFRSAVVIADRGVVFALSDTAPGVFENDEVILRVVSRYDINVHEGGDGSTAGAYVGLKTAAS